MESNIFSMGKLPTPLKKKLKKCINNSKYIGTTTTIENSTRRKLESFFYQFEFFTAAKSVKAQL
jgi:hypothetical protein